jgi:hypothetical protein
MELSPFTAGGIGRVVHNVLKSMSLEDRRRSHVLALDCKIDAAVFEATFPGAKLTLIHISDEGGRHLPSGHQPPHRAFASTPWHWKSSVVFRALRSLAAAVEIEYVEFQDWAGLGFCTIQEKKISGFLEDATLAVRLHSTHAVLAHHEAYAVHGSDLALIDIERKTLRDCDLVVAQLAAVGEQTRQLFGFLPGEWDPRVIVHAPPILLDGGIVRTETIPPDARMPILFGSKIQRIKRPDLFVRAAAAFCRHAPEYVGDVMIAAHAFDEDYCAIISRLIPPDMSGRIRFSPAVSGLTRETLVAGSTFVVPSDFESFCLAAYEASLLGARVILNARNPAFGDGTPWVHGVNCFKFDGDVRSLQATLELNFTSEQPLSPVILPSDPWPWTVSPPRFGRHERIGRPLVSIVIPFFNLGSYVLSTLTSALEQTYDNIEIIVVDDCSFDEQSTEVLEYLDEIKNDKLKIVRASGNLGLSGARNLGLSLSSGEYIAPLDADDLVDRRFIEIAVRALERNREFDVFVTPAAYFSDDSQIVLPGEEADFPDYAVFVGEALISGVRNNRYSTATALLRTDVLLQYGYNESLRSYEDWNLYLRLAQDGRRFLVSNDVYFHYRNRPDSMVKEADDPQRHAVLMHDHLRTAAHTERLIPLAYLAFLLPVQARSAPLPLQPPALRPHSSHDEVMSLVAAQLSKQMEKKAQPSRLAGLKQKLRGRNEFKDTIRMVIASDLFDGPWYLRTYPDVAAAGVDPIIHYLANGGDEGRDPGPFFSSASYFAANPDVRAAGMNPLVHYLRHGFKERRRTRSE